LKLVYFEGENGVVNFGDELNRYLWPRLIPHVFARDEGVNFVGIGTLLNDRLPKARRTVIFGAGVGYYGAPALDHSWVIYCVRGHLSAAALGLPSSVAVTDPAALIARIRLPDLVRGERRRRSFMPHWQSEPDQWRDVCERQDVAFVDPRWSVDEVLDAVRRTDVLITEAMHGAIVADALRIPWIAVRSRERINSFKWRDWCGSIDLEYQPLTLPTLWPRASSSRTAGTLRSRAKLAFAAASLGRIAARGRPLLSRKETLDARVEELEARLQRMKQTER
jgi:succinoglycan biosynthesis protein ExoV